MQTISAAADLLLKGWKELDVSLAVTGLNGSITLDGDDIIQDSFYIDRNSVSGQGIEIGNVESTELVFMLDNSDGRFDEFWFEGAEIDVTLIVGAENIKAGLFTVDQRPQGVDTISVTALDNMVRFDREYSTALTGKQTLLALLQDSCTACNVTLGTLSFTNDSYLAIVPTGIDGLTHRQVISWVAQLAGCNAWIDYEGKLRLSWYGENQGLAEIEITLDDCDADSYKIEENDVALTGVIYKTEAADYLYGTSDYVLPIEGNALVDPDNYTAAMTAIFNKINGFFYRPYAAAVRAYPHVWPMDMVQLETLGGLFVPSIVTGNRIMLGDGNNLHGLGETSTVAGYATYAPFSPAQKTAIARTSREVIQVMGIDAEWIRSGIIAADRIGAGSITAEKLAAGVISADLIDAGSITTEKLAAGAVTAEKMMAGTITAASGIIADAAITTAKIANGAITTALIDTAAVGTAQIADGSITDAKIVELTANKITSGVLSTERLIIRDPVDPTKSLIYEINNISGALQVVQGETLNGEVLTERSITADKIVAQSITAAEIAANSITANEMVAGTITSASGIIAEIDASIIDVTNLDANNITAGTIDAQFLSVYGFDKNLFQNSKFYDFTDITSTVFNAGHFAMEAFPLGLFGSPSSPPEYFNIKGWSILYAGGSSGVFQSDLDGWIFSERWDESSSLDGGVYATSVFTEVVKGSSYVLTYYALDSYLDPTWHTLARLFLSDYTEITLPTYTGLISSGQSVTVSNANATLTIQQMDVGQMISSQPVYAPTTGYKYTYVIKLPDVAAASSISLMIGRGGIGRYDAVGIGVMQLERGTEATPWKSGDDGVVGRYVEITSDGIIASSRSTVGGVEKVATVKLNGDDGLAFYDGTTKIGGLEFVQGKLGLTTSVIKREGYSNDYLLFEPAGTDGTQLAFVGNNGDFISPAPMRFLSIDGAIDASSSASATYVRGTPFGIAPDGSYLPSAFSADLSLGVNNSPVATTNKAEIKLHGNDANPYVQLMAVGDTLGSYSNVNVTTGGITVVNGKVASEFGYAFYDTRAVTSYAQNLPSRALSLEFKSLSAVGNPPVNATTSYAHILNIAGWNTSEGSGGWPAQISVGDGLAVRQATGLTTWGPWRELSIEGHTHAYASNAISITAGNGLTGGGTLAATRTLTLGTPGSCTGSTTNAVTATSHTHDISGFVPTTDVRVGAGTTHSTAGTDLQVNFSSAMRTTPRVVTQGLELGTSWTLRVGSITNAKFVIDSAGASVPFCYIAIC